jgi:uncharacterized protein
MDKVVHFEIPADDLSRAKEFYGAVFGWELQTMDEMDYTIVHTTPVDEQQMPTEPGAINGGMMKVEAAGGGVVRPKGEIPGMGSFAYVKDTEGNVVGLWENA